jgi:hypothetical protein
LLRVAFDRWLAREDGTLAERIGEVRGQLAAVR